MRGLLLVAVAAAGASAQSGILHPDGSVLVNNVAVTRAVPVYEGDKIVTGKDSSATVQSAGTQISLRAESSIVYGKSQIEVLQNGASVRTLNGMAVRDGGLTISPTASPSADFEVRKNASGTVVSASSGSVSVNDGKHAIPVNAGKSLMHQGPPVTVASFRDSDKSAGHGDSGGKGSSGHDGWGNGGDGDGHGNGGGDGHGGGDGWGNGGHGGGDGGGHGGGGGKGGGGGNGGGGGGNGGGHDSCRGDDGHDGHDHDGDGHWDGGWNPNGGSNDDHDGNHHHHCGCKHEDHHGHPESPVKPCRGDRHDEHCRCGRDGDGGKNWGW